VWLLSESTRSALLQLPETGLGFQWVLAQSGPTPGPFLVFNAEVAYDMSEVELLEGDDPALILLNGSRVQDAVQRSGSQIVGRPEPSGFVLLATRIGLPIDTSSQAPVPPRKLVTQQSSLVKKSTLSANRSFHRYSAFNPDRRVDPKTGSFLPGTYAVPASEVPFIPTGFAAVGRLALPNVQPASHHYTVEAPSGTVVEFGTVAPAFGQAGGGVEAFFAAGATNQLSPPTAPSRIPDE